MDEELDPEVIKATQISLGKYIKRPPLSEKLLKKPPFRFLHDIITSVLRTTGFFEGLFDENELVSDNVKDRDTKISFLNKAITVLSLTTGKTLSAKSSKIVAGQEPMKTNEVLQCLASALDNKLSSHDAVLKYKENAKLLSKEQSGVNKKDPRKSQKQDIKPKKLAKNENTSNKKKEPTESFVSKKENEKNDRNRKKESIVVKNETQSKNLREKLTPMKVISSRLQTDSKTHQETKTSVETTGSEQINKKPIDNIKSKDGMNVDENSQSHSHGNLDNKEDAINLDITEPKEIGDSTLEVDLQPAKNIKIENIPHDSLLGNTMNETIENHTRKKSLETNEEESHHPKIITDISLTQTQLIEPESVKKESVPNKSSILSEPLKNETIIARPVSTRPSSSRPGAPRPKEKFENIVSDTDSHLLGKVNIIVEHAQNEEEEDSSIIIMDQENSKIISNVQQEELSLSVTENEHGHLVQQILDSQKEFTQVTGKTEIEWQFGAQKAKEAQHQEIDQLRYNIQALTRVTNPLGKLLDHIQEDVEVMRQELQQWSNIFEDVSNEIQKQNAINEDALLPLLSKIKQLELDIQEKSEKINDLKVSIYKNSSRIEKLLANGNVQ